MVNAIVVVAGCAAALAPGGDMRSVSELFGQFVDPSREFRIAPLLRTNDHVTRDEIRWQVRAMKEAGCGGTFTYCERMSGGFPHDFLSAEWWQAVRWTAEACAEEGLDFWVYDDEDWPSGRAGDQLVAEHPEWSWHYLSVEPHSFHGPGPCTLTLPEDGVMAVVAYQVKDDRVVADSCLPLTIASGRVEWNVPEGDWTVAVYRTGTGPGFFTVGLADLMNGTAMEEYVERVYEGHRATVADVPGLNFVGYFTDEPCGSVSMTQFGDRFPWFPSLPYTPELPARFSRNAGVDFVTALPMLHDHRNPDHLKLQLAFWRTCAELLGENYFGRIQSYCDAHGLEATGHLNGEELFQFHLAQYFGDLARMYRFMHTPGIDWIVPLTNPLPAVVPKYATSSAHLLDRKRAWCESFAGAGWGLTFDQIHAIVNWEHVNGIGFQIPISYKYSLRGPQRATFYNPGISYQQPYWRHFKGFADYEARLCALASGVGHVAQVALAYPGVDIQAHAWDHETLNVRSQEYNQLGDRLRFAGYDFDILDDDGLVHDARVVDGKLVTSTESFSVLILPRMDVVRRDVARRCREFAESGGMVVLVGNVPAHSPEYGANDPELAGIFSILLDVEKDGNQEGSFAEWRPCGAGAAALAHGPEDALRLLSSRLTPDVRVEPVDAALVSYHRRLTDGEIYLLMNRSDTSRRVQVTLSAMGYPELWEPRTGEVTSIGVFERAEAGTRLTLEFLPQELKCVVLRDEASPHRSVAPSKTTQIFALDGPFRFRTIETMAHPHVAWNFADDDAAWTSTSVVSTHPDEMPLGDWCDHGLKHFSGIGVYETEVNLDAVPGGARMFLNLGQVAQTAEVFVNGVSMGYVCLPPYRLDVTSGLRAGANTIRIEVANTLANYYAQFQELSNAPIHAGGDSPERLVSGLLGPVTLSLVM